MVGKLFLMWQDRGVRLAALLLVVALSSIVLLVVTSPENFSIADVHLDPGVLELGQVGEGKHRLSFRLVNNSRFAIDVLSVSATCACSQLEVPRGEVPAGGTVDGELTWSLLQADGPTSSSFIVHCSTHGRSQDQVPEPGGPRLFDLIGRMQADVVPWWRTEPKQVVFFADQAGTDGGNSVREVPVQIVPLGEADVRVLSNN